MILYAKWAKIEKPNTSETPDNPNRFLYTGGLIASLGVIICVCMFVKKKKMK